MQFLALREYWRRLPASRPCVRSNATGRVSHIRGVSFTFLPVYPSPDVLSFWSAIRPHILLKKSLKLLLQTLRVVESYPFTKFDKIPLINFADFSSL